jgi:hypothetical protein
MIIKDVTVGPSPEECNIQNVLLNTPTFLPHNTKGMLHSVLREWSLTSLQYVQEMMVLNLRRIEVEC